MERSTVFAMPETQTAAKPVSPSPPGDARIARSKPSLRHFGLLALPLALLLALFQVYRLEQPAFLTLAQIVFAAFAVSYWLPFRFKQDFLIATSVAGAYVLLGPAVASLLLASGLLMWGIVRSGLEFRWKVVALLGIFGLAAWGRAGNKFGIPGEFWPVFGSMFLFRMTVCMYDAKYMRAPVGLRDYLSYFFLLPNYYFLLFPVVDFTTFRKSWFKRDIDTVAQQGVWWIFRGATHLMLYRLIYQVQGRFTPPHVPVAVAVAAKAAFAYLLYLRISGQFHIIAGMLCLFGYDLPETNHRYLLARGITDFWRRINIYWKDFMVKVFYYPVYFKLRRGGELRAKLLATMLVFVVTWFLHSVQYYWLQGKFLMSSTNSVFWAVLGALVMADVWLESRRPKRAAANRQVPRLLGAVQIVATFALISLLWSLWSVNSLTEWFLFLKTGNV
jgi:hypothetical protein